MCKNRHATQSRYGRQNECDLTFLNMPHGVGLDSETVRADSGLIFFKDGCIGAEIHWAAVISGRLKLVEGCTQLLL